MRLTSPAILLVVISAPLVTAQQPHQLSVNVGKCLECLFAQRLIRSPTRGATQLDVQHEIACIGYVEGVAQGESEEVAYVLAMTSKEPPGRFCLPEESENGQLVRIVLKYIGKHPEEAHYSTAFLIASALREAFPCTTHK